MSTPAIQAIGLTKHFRGEGGETVTAVDILLPGGMAIAITAAALFAQARLLRNERIIFSR